MHDWEEWNRKKFSDIDIFVGIAGVTPEESFVGPFVARTREKQELKLEVRDSYARREKLDEENGERAGIPNYAPLFYSLLDISITDGVG